MRVIGPGGKRSLWEYLFLPRLSARGVMVLVAVVAAAIFILPPLISTTFSAFRGPPTYLPFEADARWSMESMSNAYTTGVLIRTIRDTMIFVVGSVALAFIFGLTIAWLVERTDLPLRNAVFTLMFVPVALPPLVTSIGWIILLGPRTGVVNLVIRGALGLDGVGPINPFTMYAMIFVQALGLTFLVFIFLAVAFRSMDSSFEEASRASGAGFLTTLRRVTIPILRPSVLSVMLLAIIFAIESFEIPMLLSASGTVADIFATRVWFALHPLESTIPRLSDVAALGFHFLLITYFLFFLYSRFTKRADRYATITARAHRPRRYSLGRWRWPLFGLVAFFLFVQVAMPFLVLLWTSFFPNYRPPSWEAVGMANLDQWRGLFGDRRIWSAFGNSLIVAVSASTISVICAVIIAWAITRAKRWTIFHTILDLFISSSLAIPSTVAATGFLLYFLSLPNWIPIYGTLFMLILAYAYRMTTAYRINRAGIVQISRDLEDQSATSGGTPFQTLRRVVVPLIAPNLLAAWLILFILGFREFTLPIFLAPDRPITVGVLIWKLYQVWIGRAAALSVLTALFLILIVGTARFVAVQRRKPAGGLDDGGNTGGFEQGRSQ